MGNTARRLGWGIAGMLGCHAGVDRNEGTAPAAPEPTAIPASEAVTPGAVVPETRITITNLAPGVFALDVSERLAVRSIARIERRGDDGTWAPVANLDGGTGLRLTTTCEQPVPACLEAAPGTPLLPVRFSGMGCSAQCNTSCDKNVGVGPGSFRLAVDTCDGHTFAGPAFELPSDRRPEAMVRWGVGRDAVRATMMRMHDPDAAKDRATGVDKLVEWRVRPGTERPLDATQLERLRDLLAAPDGYDDDIMKRCRMDHLVGVRLVRAPASTGVATEETLEVVLDLTCNKLFVRGATDRHRWDHATHFDPSHAAWRDFVRQVLVDDRELARVK